MKKMRVKFLDKLFKRRKYVYENDELELFADRLDFDLFYCFGNFQTFSDLLGSFERSTNNADYNNSYSKVYLEVYGDMLVELVITETKNLPISSPYACLFSIGKKTYAMFVYEDL